MRVSIAGVVAAASLGVSASSASAADVWLWACHGPGGQAITGTPLTANNATRLGEGCALDSSAGAPAGYRLKLADAPTDGLKSSLVIPVPTGLSAKAVKVERTLRGFEGSTGISYRVSANGQTLESDTDQKSGVIPISTPASSVTLELSCSSACASTAEVDITSVAFLVSDDTAPTGGVSWNSPVDHSMEVTPSFTDSGVGLDRAELSVGGRVISAEFGACRELSPADATNDRPLDPGACRTGDATAGADQPLKAIPAKIVAWADTPELDKDGKHTGKWLALDPMRLPEGMFRRVVTVYDAAGNKTEISGDVEVWHPAEPIATRTLNISTASVTEQGGNNNNNGNKNDGNVLGDQASQCRSPRLSVVLNTKPVRVSKNVPVLKYKKAYRFKGRLTCVINGKRQSAPKRTKVSILNKVGKKTVRKPNTAIRAKGAVDLKLAFVSNRTVIFRYTNAAGQKSEVKIKVRITKKKK